MLLMHFLIKLHRILWYMLLLFIIFYPQKYYNNMQKNDLIKRKLYMNIKISKDTYIWCSLQDFDNNKLENKTKFDLKII